MFQGPYIPHPEGLLLRLRNQVHRSTRDYLESLVLDDQQDSDEVRYGHDEGIRADS